jgi:type IV pilus assembly protein PilA
MAVLVGVLAPQFIKYVEQSRRSRDIQTAQEIREAVLADIADGSLTGSGSVTAFTTLSTISEEPTVSGHVSGASSFTATYDAVSGTCSVKCGSYDLTTESGASNYKAA